MDGTACNFIHCFWNPGGDYEWGDSDRPPPKYWGKMMVSLFDYSDDYEALRERENLSLPQNISKMSKADSDSDRDHSSRSRSREMDQLSSFSGRRKHGHEQKQRTLDAEWSANLTDNHKMKRNPPETNSDRDWWDKDEDRENHHKHPKKSLLDSNMDDNSKSIGKDIHMDCATTTRDNEIEHCREHRNSQKGNRGRWDYIYEAESDGDRKRHHISRRESPRQQSGDTRTGEAESNKNSFDREHLETRDCSRKSLRRRRSGLRDDNKDRLKMKLMEVGHGC